MGSGSCAGRSCSRSRSTPVPALARMARPVPGSARTAHPLGETDDAPPTGTLAVGDGLRHRPHEAPDAPAARLTTRLASPAHSRPLVRSLSWARSAAPHPTGLGPPAPARGPPSRLPSVRTGRPVGQMAFRPQQTGPARSGRRRKPNPACAVAVHHRSGSPTTCRRRPGRRGTGPAGHRVTDMPGLARLALSSVRGPEHHAAALIADRVARSQHSYVNPAYVGFGNRPPLGSATVAEPQ